MKNPFKDFLYFSRGERRGILVLIIGIVLIFLSGYIYSFRQNSRQLSEEESRIQAAALKEYDNYNPQIEMFAHFKTKSSFHKTKGII